MKVNRTAKRTIEILELIATSTEDLTLNDIATKLEMPKTSAFDILETLVELNMLYIKEHRLKTYAIGVKAYAIGNTYSKTSLLLNSAAPILKEISQQTGLTTFICKENNDRIIYTLKSEPQKRILATPEIGDQGYLHSTAIGKAILAFSPNQEDLLSKLDLVALTPRTITTKVALKNELMSIKAQGYSMCDRENEEHTAAIAAPIFDYNGIVSSAIGAVGLYKDDYHYERDIMLIKEAAYKISRSLGYVGPDNF